MESKIKVGEHYWFREILTGPSTEILTGPSTSILKVEEIVAGGKDFVIRGLALDCDNLTVIRKKNVSEEELFGPVSQGQLNYFREKMEQVIANFFQ